MLFPKKCLECSASGRYLCNRCLKKVPEGRQICPICRYYSYLGQTHKSCQKPLGLEGHYSLWKYDGVIKKAVWALKYRFAYDVAKELSDLCARRLNTLNTKYWIQNTVLVPIPLHRKRKNWRGFNQAEVVGELVAKKMGWNFNSGIIFRKSASISQVGLNREERLRNICGKYAVNTKYLIPHTKYPILLFDDVWTTGTTLKEACKVLKKAGAKEVWGLTIAG